MTRFARLTSALLMGVLSVAFASVALTGCRTHTTIVEPVRDVPEHHDDHDHGPPPPPPHHDDDHR